MELLPELLGESMQTWEEFRYEVECQIYGINLENDTPGSAPTTPIEKVVFEPPNVAEQREEFPHHSSLTSILDRS